MQRQKNGAKTRTAGRTVNKKRKQQGNRKTPQPLGLTYRARTPEDDAYILQLTEEQLGTTHRDAFGEPFPRDQFARYIASGAPTYVVLHHGKRIGYYSYLVAHDGRMHISALVLDKGHQSAGLGTEVMNQVEKEAVSLGAHTLEVFVQENNAQSMAFTRKLGFVEVYRPAPNTMAFHKRVSRPQTPDTTSRQPASFVNPYAGQGPEYW